MNGTTYAHTIRKEAVRVKAPFKPATTPPPSPPIMVSTPDTTSEVTVVDFKSMDATMDLMRDVNNIADRCVGISNLIADRCVGISNLIVLAEKMKGIKATK